LLLKNIAQIISCLNLLLSWGEIFGYKGSFFWVMWAHKGEDVATIYCWWWWFG